MLLLFSILKDNRRSFSLAIVLSFLSALAGVSVIAFINQALTKLNSVNTFPLTVFFGLIFVLFILSFVSQAMMTALGHHIVCQLRLSLSRRIMNTSVERLDQLGLPVFMATLTKDITMISHAFNSLPFVVFGTSVMLLSYSYLFWLSSHFFLVTLGMTVIAVSVGRKLMLIARNLRKQVREVDDVLFDCYDAMLHGRNELKLSLVRRKSYYQNQLLPVVNNACALDTKADRMNVLNASWINTAVLLIIAIIILLHTQYQWGELHQVTGYALTILFLRSPLAGLVGSLPALLSGSVAFAKVTSLQLEQSNTETQPNQVPAQNKHWGVLSLHQVEYQYPSQSQEEKGFAVGPVNLTIQQGELIFWVGGNGSGKSTCARLLTGLYTPQKGQILFDGQEVNADNLAWYRNHFSVVFADFYLFKQLINEAGALPPQQLIDHYLNKLALSGKLTVAQGMLSNTKLSQGQRKRLALLLAYLEDRSIIVLDEWAADQDPVFRRIFYTELLPEMKAQGKTIIAITHDDHYFDVADSIYRLEAGCLIRLPHQKQAKVYADASG